MYSIEYSGLVQITDETVDFTQLVFEVTRSFKVMHFEITRKPTTDCISPYYNAGPISKVYEIIASENAENCRSRQPHCRLTPLPGVPPQIFA